MLQNGATDRAVGKIKFKFKVLTTGRHRVHRGNRKAPNAA